MKKITNGTRVLVWTLVCAALSFSSCGNKNVETKVETPAADEQFQPDARFASIDTLADHLVADLMNNDTLNTVEELEQSYERLATAVKSYWMLNHEGEDQATMDETVCKDLQARVDSLSGGSTFDMMQSALINGAVSRYLMAQDYCKNYRENPLYQAEMSDWLKLEKELSGFYCDLASLANWGGSIVNITSSGALAHMAKTRQEDYSQLKKGGKYADSESLTIAEAREDFIQELADAKSLEAFEDISNIDDFNKTLNDMRGHADKVVELLDKWLESRAKLGEAEGVPESHTAHFIAKLGIRIMELIEG